MIAVAVCRVLYFIGKKLGRGSSFPGLAALRLSPDVLSRLKLPKIVIAVTGSNGKTTTVDMIAHVLKDAGMSVECNHEGSNQIEALATLLLRVASFGGVVRCDALVIECDERSARVMFEAVKPDVIVITNLCRDQLTRNGHHEFIQDCVQSAIDAAGGEAKLVLNADDPYTAALSGQDVSDAKGKLPGSAPLYETIWFGIGRSAVGGGVQPGIYDDGAFCPKCKARMTYEYRVVSHMGAFRCVACRRCRRMPDVEVTGINMYTGEIMLCGGLTSRLAFPSLAGAYNMAAAIAASQAVGISVGQAARALDNYELKGGRATTFPVAGREGTLLVSKHENSLSYNQSLTYAAGRGSLCTVVILVDAISRRYYTSETSWMWDVDFNILAAGNIHSIVLAGQYVNELAARFELTAIESGKICCVEDISRLNEYVINKTEGEIFALTCFADKQKLVNAFAGKGDIS